MYLVVTGRCIFKIIMLEIAICENFICDQRWKCSFTKCWWYYKQSKSQQYFGKALDLRAGFHAEYWCVKCNLHGSTKNIVSVVRTSDVLIMQLLIFRHENNVSQKLKPNLIANEEITIFRNTTIYS